MRNAGSRYAHSICIAGSGRVLDAARSADERGSSAPSLRRAWVVGILVALTAAFAAVSAPAASAEDTGHAYSFSFKGSGTNELSSYLTGIAIRESNGDVYVVDQGNYRIEVFDSSGNFKFMFGKEVNATTKGFTCSAGETCQAGSYANPPEGIYGASYLAIDQNTGAVYVSGSYCCPFSGYVEKFDANGNLETGWQSNGFTDGSNTPSGAYEPYGIDTDGAGNLLVMAGYSPKRIVKYNPAGTTITEYPVNHEVSGGLAWSPQNFLYYSNGNYESWNVRRMSETATNQVDFGKYWNDGGFQRYAYPPAVDRSTGDVFAPSEISNSNGEHVIMEWQVNGAGQPLQSDGVTPCAKTLSDGTSGCAPTHEFGRTGPTYPEPAIGDLGSSSYRLAINGISHAVYGVATRPTAAGGYEGRVNVFIKGKTPKAVTGAPTANKTVSGTAMPDGASEIVKCEFEYGATRDYGSTQPCSPAPPYASTQAVTANLPVSNETTNHYRLVVKNAEGATAIGADKTLVPHNVLGVETLSPEEVKRTSAKLRGSFQGNGEATEYWFRWGTTSSYTGGETAHTPVGGPPPTYPPATEVSAPVSGLMTNTLYHFQVVFKNGEGITYGNDLTFTSAEAVKSLSTQPAAEVLRKTAKLNGTFMGDATEGEGNIEYWFEWGKSANYTASTPIQTTTPPGTVNPTVLLTGCGKEGTDPGTCLELETPYHYRLVAKNNLGTTYGLDQQFTTLPAVGGVTTLPAAQISDESVTLNGEFTGNSEATEYWFEYGPTTTYGLKTAAVNTGSPAGVTPASSVTTEFKGFTTYHYRLVAKNPVGETFGQDVTFETPKAELPAAGSTQASNVSGTGATLSAQINPNRWATVYSFEYGPTTQYGESTVIKDVIDGNLNSPVPVSASISELAPGTTYHVRVVAVNFVGTAYGADATFSTPGLPTIESLEVGTLTSSTAHLTGVVIPNSSSTTIHFEYSSGAGSPSSTAESAPIGADTGRHPVNTDLVGLSPGTAYHFRLVATNGIGATTSVDGSFTTTAGTSGHGQTEPGPVKCKKGFVKRKGKCVRRKKHRTSQHKKHHRGGRNG